MNVDAINEVEAEVARFIKRLGALREAAKSRPYAFNYGPEAAATKRASLDLTRAPAKMRSH
jgi:hypothetical protein